MHFKEELYYYWHITDILQQRSLMSYHHFAGLVQKVTVFLQSLSFLGLFLLCSNRHLLQGKNAFSVTVVGMMIMTVLVICLAHCKANDEIEIGGDGGWG